MLVAVYGTLKSDQHNHNKYLSNAKYVGTFESLPIYNFFSINDMFPGITKNGHSSVLMEVYKVDKTELNAIDILEGYKNSNEEGSMYLRREIETPFGVAFTYFYNNTNKNNIPITNTCDWGEYISIKTISNVL